MRTSNSRPHILVWGINYAPEETGIAPYNSDLCSYLNARGCDVSMVTAFSYYPYWRKRPADQWRLFRSEQDNGVNVYRCGLYVPSSPTAVRRMIHEASFATVSFLSALFLRRPNAILVVSPPLLLGAAGRILSLIKRAPYFFHVQDMQPDAAIQMGFLRKGVLTKILYRLESIALQGAAQVSGITEGMRQMFTDKGVPEERTALFPNWQISSGESKELLAEPPVSFRQKHGLSPKTFVVAYSGNLGRKQGISILLDAALILQQSASDLQILIAGDGGEKELLEKRVRQENLPNVTLLPLLPREDYLALLKEADAFVVTQQAGSGALFFPSKLLPILSAGKPVIAVADESSELHRAVAEGGFGASVPPGLPAELAHALEAFLQDPVKVAAMAERGPAWMLRFDRKKVLDGFYQRLAAYGVVSQNQAKNVEPNPSEELNGLPPEPSR